MNQILEPENNCIYVNKTKNKTSKFYLFVFICSSLIACLSITFFYLHNIKLNENEKISSQLLHIYNVSTLYSENNNYSADFLKAEIDKNSSIPTSELFVIGLLKIDKIQLTYPILSQSNEDLLDISLCRFAGPMPHQIGNLCIAGHNYVDYKFFSRLNELEIEDTIEVYDLTGKFVEYTIFKKYEVNPDDLSCTLQNTDGKSIITLITCNNVSGKRLVVVANTKQLQ